MIWYLIKGLIALFGFFISLGIGTLILSLILFLIVKQKQQMSTIYLAMLLMSLVGIFFFTVLGSFYSQFAIGLTAYVSKPIAFIIVLGFVFLIFKFTNDEFKKSKRKILSKEFILNTEINQFTKSNIYDTHRILSFRYVIFIAFLLFSFMPSWIPSIIFNFNSSILERFF